MASSSSHSCLKNPWNYGIFLSFCGKDTRKSFTDHLYDALVRRGVITFRDEDNLERGEEIGPNLLEAIEESWGSIVVLSEGYAYSRWCLDELAKILEQREENGHKVYPIFYHVLPSIVRHQREKVKEAFDQHEKRFSEEVILRWRNALSQVANLKGWHLEHELESKFINDSLGKVLVKLSQTQQIYSRLKDLLDKEDDEVRIIGISGTRQTALARAVYTQMSFQFEVRCFLPDVRKVSTVCLQQRLLSQIFPKETFDFSEMGNGNATITDRLRQKKALIVIDNVSTSHLECFVGRSKDLFGSGSRVIVTAKDAHLLQSFGVDELCKPTTSDADNTGLAATSDEKKYKDLKRKLEEITKDVKSRMSREHHPRKKLKEEVEPWLGKAERILGESSGSSRGLFRPDVVKMPEVEELIKQGTFPDGLVDDVPGRSITLPSSTTPLLGEAANTCFQEVWEHLTSDSVFKIGVWGMGGVGKTTIAKHVENQLLKEPETFGKVIWITVSQENNIFQLQNKIASEMDLRLSVSDDQTRRAREIHRKLSGEGKYVLIIDDLWDEHFSVEEVGIPEPSSECKLLVTTRLYKVCTYLACQTIEVRPLSEPDAWTLFSHKVGQNVLNNADLLPHVESVAKECCGLPLAIVTIASSMRDEVDISEWRNALRELKTNASSVSGMEDKVFRRLRFSYDRLRDEKLKNCFLCCALYPEDDNIYTSGLIELWIAEGLVEEMESRQEEIDKGHTMLNKLKNSCLLEIYNPDVDVRYVKLHDVVRDMALRIQRESRRPCVLINAGMQLTVIPDVEEWTRDLEKVSLMKNLELQIPPQMRPPNCPKLRTLLLSGCNVVSIPECFFEHMRGLKTLDLSSNYRIKRLPNSISNLEALTTLLLGWCTHLKEVPSFSKLKALKKLDLQWTGITYLFELERLVNLRYLQLAHKFEKDENVADGIFTKLACLNHLVIYSTYLKGGEIGGLRNLDYFEGWFLDLNEFSCYIELAQKRLPMGYSICVGREEHRCSGQSNSKKKLTIFGGKICTGGIKILSNVERLAFVECSIVETLGEENAFFELFKPMPHNRFSFISDISVEGCRKIKKLFPFTWVLPNLQNLQRLHVEGCKEMEEIITISKSELEELEGISAGTVKSITLPKLYALELKDLPELKNICSVNGVMVCDSLKRILIQGCPKLKNVLSGVLQQNLPNLDKLRVTSCDEMEEIITISESELKELEGVTGGTIKSITLPRFLCLELTNLQKLKRICSANGVMKCNFIYKISLVNCPKLKNVFSFKGVLQPNLPNLKELQVGGCEEMEEIIAISISELEELEGISAGTIKSIILSKLESLHLSDLPELKSICSANGVMVCDFIVHLSVVKCPKLKNVLSSKGALLPNLPKLERLSVGGCQQIEEIITMSESEWEESDEIGTIKSIALPKLVVLRLWHLPELKRICSINRDSIRDIDIINCPKLKNVFSFKGVLQPNLLNLKKLHVRGCEEMEEIIEIPESELELEELEGIPAGTIKSITLSKLERLELEGLPELKNICSADGVMVCDFIDHLSILKCPKLKNVLSSKGALQPNLPKLEHLYVRGCKKVEEIVAMSESEWQELDEIGTIKSIALPKLELLWLRDLPELKRICSITRDSIRVIDIKNCPKLKRISVLDLPRSADHDGQLSIFPGIKYFHIQPIEQWEWMEWNHPNAKSQLEPFVYDNSKIASSVSLRSSRSSLGFQILYSHRGLVVMRPTPSIPIPRE